MTRNCALFILSIAVSICCVTATPVDWCDDAPWNKGAEVTVYNCKETPCSLVPGKPVEITVKFSAQKDVKRLYRVFRGKLGRIDLPVVGVHLMNGCTDILDEQLKPHGCPLKKDESYVHRSLFTVPSVFPAMNTTLTWGLREKLLGKPVICFRFNSEIKPEEKSR